MMTNDQHEKDSPPDAKANLSLRLREAQAAARAGDSARAEDLYRSIVSDQPEMPSATLGLIKILEQRGGRAEAEGLLRRLIETAPANANIVAAAQLWEAWQDSPLPGAGTIRIALTGTGTLGPLGAHLRVATAQIGLHPALYVSDFNQWAQDLLPPQSPLHQFAPDLIIVLLDAPTVFPTTATEVSADKSALAADLESGVKQIRGLLTAATKASPSATVLLHTLPLPDFAPLGILDLKTEQGQRERYTAINNALVSLVREEFPRVALFDQERVESRHGKGRVRDERLWYMAGMPFSESFLPVMAAEYLRTIRPLKGLVRKCVVLDLDNTLWGGVVGEDGINGIKIGGSAAPGNAFWDFQAALNALRSRGILLALCSKNNPDDVWPVFESHPDMVLRREDFAAVRVNWQDKASNLREIARELNIGLDSLVFLDDNPMERGLIRQELPGVLTVELPRDPAFYAQTLKALDVFESLAITDEDQRRNELYQQQQARKQFEESSTGGSGDVTDYLTGLQITVKIAPLTPFTLPRAAQLINKTNQFNMTTRRYTEAEIQAKVLEPERWEVYSVTVADRFGDSGLTGVILVEKEGATWTIDSFLLSCRVLGRGIEDASVAFVQAEAQAAGAKRLRGLFIPSAKNEPASGFYARKGFAQLPTHGQGEEDWWEMPLHGKESAVAYPEWLTVHATGEQAHD